MGNGEWGNSVFSPFPTPHSPLPWSSIGFQLLFLFVAENHSSVTDGPAFGGRQEEDSANAAPTCDEIYAPRQAAVFGLQHGRVVDRRFVSACVREECRRPSARRVEELAVVSGAARYAE